GVFSKKSHFQCLYLCLATDNVSRLRVHVQVCYIAILIPSCCTVPSSSSPPSLSTFSSA
uniref:Uncharacterized protein n=1 Tax=Macaca fascicularis TaxID=9541 RepID=A0A7N9CNM7_MACFA